ncbi:MAG: alpha/beta fold hydrolase [Brachymonas sp.]
MSLIERLQAMPTSGCALPFNGFVRFREAGQTNGQEPVVLMHGIGSGSGSWVYQLQAAGPRHVLAWDAPGYADSSPLKSSEPTASDYAHILWAWLDQMNIERVHLVGHSLGCLMAASAARLQPQRIEQLTLLAPAQGYGRATAEVQAAKKQQRLSAMETLGMREMALQRAPRLLSPAADTEHLALAKQMMGQLNVGGYTQATHMLSVGDIHADLHAFRAASAAKITVACGQADVITPPAACQALAKDISAPYIELRDAGHLCALEAANSINDLLQLSIPARPVRRSY